MFLTIFIVAFLLILYINEFNHLIFIVGTNLFDLYSIEILGLKGRMNCIEFVLPFDYFCI